MREGVDGGWVPSPSGAARTYQRDRRYETKLLVLRKLTGVLALFLVPPKPAGGGGDEGIVTKMMEFVVKIRANARKAKDFATNDLVRSGLG